MILTDSVDFRVPLTIPVGNIILGTTQFDQVIPGIHLTNMVEYWTPDKLRSHGFTHIINIDQHISNNRNNQITSNSNSHTCSNSTNNSSNNNNNNSLSQSSYTKSTPSDISTSFKVLDLDFGEASYLTTVLPNCYKAVKFIDKALQSGGSILVIDRNGDQKCLTIVIGYIMYKNNITFNDAFQKVKNVFTKAELERFFIIQLYEYEPILQVQRTFSRGHSYSGDLRRSFLKRKKLIDDTSKCDINSNFKQSYNSDACSDIAME